MNLAASTLALVFSAALAGAPVHTQSAAPQPALTFIPKVETVHDSVESYFSDIPIMVAIAGCESHFRQFNINGTAYRGEQNHKDVGVMQINEDYHLDAAQALGLNIYSLQGNMEYARHLYEQEGTAPWSSSEYCWGKSNVAKLASEADATKALASASK